MRNCVKRLWKRGPLTILGNRIYWFVALFRFYSCSYRVRNIPSLKLYPCLHTLTDRQNYVTWFFVCFDIEQFYLIYWQVAFSFKCFYLTPSVIKSQTNWTIIAELSPESYLQHIVEPFSALPRGIFSVKNPVSSNNSTFHNTGV